MQKANQFAFLNINSIENFFPFFTIILINKFYFLNTINNSHNYIIFKEFRDYCYLHKRFISSFPGGCIQISSEIARTTLRVSFFYLCSWCSLLYFWADLNTHSPVSRTELVSSTMLPRFQGL